MCISEWEVDVGSQWQKWVMRSSKSLKPSYRRGEPSERHKHINTYCDVVRRGTPEGTTRNPVRLGARGPKFQQTSIENRSKTSISSSSICSVQHFHPISKIQIETCPPFLPQTCHAIMPHLSPHPFRWSYTEDAAGAGAAAGWAAPWLCSPAMLVAVGIHNPRRNPTWRWTSVFAMIAVAQPTQKWLWAKSPSGSI